MNFPFNDAVFILDRLAAHGFDAYVVGGAVRDYVLGRAIHDIDIATSAHPADVVALFERTVPIGIDHGTVAVIHGRNSYEVTTFRSEDGYEDFRHPSQVAYVSSLEQDLMRRDFTINALAMDRAGTIIDLFNGRDDLKKKRIRMVGRPEERITEDPLRIMRGIRFASELEFSLGLPEQRAFTEKAFLLKKISIERINQEMTRLLAGRGVNDAVRLLFATGCIRMLPMLEDADRQAADADIRYHVLESDEERWAAFLYGQRIGTVPLFAKAWKWSNDMKRKVTALTQCLRDHVQRKEWNRESVYFAGLQAAKATLRLQVALGMAKETELPDAEQTIERFWNACPIHSRSDMKVTGNDLLRWADRKPGPWLAEALHDLEREIVNGRVENRLEVIRRWFEKRQSSHSKRC